MDEIPLSNLEESSPRNALSPAARRRLALAHSEAERIQWEAESVIKAKGLHGHEAAFERNQANLRAAQAVLIAAFEEYKRAALTTAQLQGAMNEEIQAAANSLDLNQPQRQMLQTEYYSRAFKHPDVDDQKSPAHAKVQRSYFPNRASWLKLELDKRSWTKHDVQRFNGPNHKTTQKILDGQPVQDGALERLARALSSKGFPSVAVTDIPSD